MNVSRKVIVKFSSFSMVSLVFGCMILMYWKNCSRLHLCRMRNTLSTRCSHIFGGLSAAGVAVALIDFKQISGGGCLLEVWPFL